LEEVREKEEAPSAGGRQPAFEEGDDVMLNVVPGDDAWAWFAGAVQDFDLFLGQESSGQGRVYDLFFFDRP